MNKLSRLRWQCRRGTLELDVLLTRYLETHYLTATSEEQALFVELLSFEDDVLLTLLLGESEKIPDRFQPLVLKLRGLSV